MNETHVSEAVRTASLDIAVSPPPTANIVLGGVRRRRARGAGIGAVAGCALLAGAALAGLVNLPKTADRTPVASGGTNYSQSSGAEAGGRARALTRSDVEAYLAELPGVALVLPATLPEGYRWDGPTNYETGDDGQAVTRSSTFSSVNSPSTDASVDVCAHTPEGHACPQGTTRFVRNVDGVEVVISFTQTPTSSQLEFWEEVPFTDIPQVSWLADK